MQAKHKKSAKYALTKWLERENISIHKFSKETGFAYQAVYVWIKRTGIPSLLGAIAIEEYTDGEIPCRLWKFDEEDKRRYSRKIAKPKHKKTSKPKESQQTKEHNKKSPKGKR